MRTEIFSFGVGGVGSIVEDTDIKGSTVEVDNGIFGGLLVIGGFGDGAKKRAGLHFDNSEVIFRIFLEKGFIF